MPLSRRRCELLNLCVRTSMLAVPSRCSSNCRPGLQPWSAEELDMCHGRWCWACVSGCVPMKVMESSSSVHNGPFSSSGSRDDPDWVPGAK